MTSSARARSARGRPAPSSAPYGARAATASTASLTTHHRLGGRHPGRGRARRAAQDGRARPLPRLRLDRQQRRPRARQHACRGRRITLVTLVDPASVVASDAQLGAGSGRAASAALAPARRRGHDRDARDHRRGRRGHQRHPRRRGRRRRARAAHLQLAVGEYEAVLALDLLSPGWMVELPLRPHPAVL